MNCQKCSGLLILDYHFDMMDGVEVEYGRCVNCGWVLFNNQQGGRKNGKVQDRGSVGV